jgi:hypothetical protein
MVRQRRPSVIKASELALNEAIISPLEEEGWP